MLPILALALQVEPLYLRMLRDIPHNPAAIFVYILVLISIIAVWRGGRSKA